MSHRFLLFTLLCCLCFGVVLAQDLELNTSYVNPDNIDRHRDDYFSESVSMDGLFMAVSSSRKMQNSDSNLGAVFMYRYDSLAEQWSETQIIIPDSIQRNSLFGYKVVVSDSNLFISAPGDFSYSEDSVRLMAGAVYHYQLDSSNTWIYKQLILPEYHEEYAQFGRSLDAYGNVLLIGIPFRDSIPGVGRKADAGLAALYLADISGTWIPDTLIYGDTTEQEDDWFGHAVSVHGSRIAIAVPNDKIGLTDNAGRVRIYNLLGDTAVNYVIGYSTNTPEDGGRFGWAIDLSDNWLLVGTNNHPSAEIINLIDGKRTSLTNTYPKEVLISGNLAFLLNNNYSYTEGLKSYRGLAWVYKLQNDSWDSLTLLHSPITATADPSFAFSISSNGSDIVIGSPQCGFNTNGDYVQNAGTAFIFHKVPCSNSRDSLSLEGCVSVTSPLGKVYNQSGTYIDSLLHVSGCSKIWDLEVTIHQSYNKTIDTFTCGNYILPDGTGIGDSLGSFYFVFSTVHGCDSNLTINVQQNFYPNTSIYLEKGVLKATKSQLPSYQWLDCISGYSPIEGAQNDTYIPTVEGIYALEVRSDQCVDTTTCLKVLNSQLVDSNEIILTVAYDLANNQVTILISKEQRFVTLELYTIDGRIISRQVHNDVSEIVLDLPPSSGVYLIVVKSSEIDARSLKVIRF